MARSQKAKDITGRRWIVVVHNRKTGTITPVLEGPGSLSMLQFDKQRDARLNALDQEYRDFGNIIGHVVRLDLTPTLSHH